LAPLSEEPKLKEPAVTLDETIKKRTSEMCSCNEEGGGSFRYLTFRIKPREEGTPTKWGFWDSDHEADPLTTTPPVKQEEKAQEQPRSIDRDRELIGERMPDLNFKLTCAVSALVSAHVTHETSRYPYVHGKQRYPEYGSETYKLILDCAREVDAEDIRFRQALRELVDARVKAKFAK
jgi:hypothetical protein